MRRPSAVANLAYSVDQSQRFKIWDTRQTPDRQTESPQIIVSRFVFFQIFHPLPIETTINEASSSTHATAECLDRSDPTAECLGTSDHKREQSTSLQMWGGKKGKEDNTKRYSGSVLPDLMRSKVPPLH